MKINYYEELDEFINSEGFFKDTAIQGCTDSEVSRLNLKFANRLPESVKQYLHIFGKKLYYSLPYQRFFESLFDVLNNYSNLAEGYQQLLKNSDTDFPGNELVEMVLKNRTDNFDNFESNGKAN